MRLSSGQVVIRGSLFVRRLCSLFQHPLWPVFSRRLVGTAAARLCQTFLQDRKQIDRAEVAAAQQTETQFLWTGRRVQRDRNIDQTETDGPLPNGAHAKS